MERTITPVTGNPTIEASPSNNTDGFSYFSIIKWSIVILFSCFRI